MQVSNVLLFISDKVCRPDPNIYKEEKNYRALYHSNLAAFIILFVASTFGMPLMSFTAPKDHILRYGFLLTVYWLVFLSCGRKRVLWFQLYNGIVSCIFGPYVAHTNKDLVLHSLIGALYCPMLSSFFTGNSLHYAASAVFQGILLVFYYPDYIERYISGVTSARFIFDLTTALLYYRALNLILHLGVSYWLEKAQSQICYLKQVEYAAEKQKNFLLTISHELRNPLNSMMGSIQAALFEKLSPNVSELLGTAEVCGEYLLHMINNILDSGKLEVDELEINLAPTKIKEIFERVWVLSSSLIKRRSLKGYQKISKFLPSQLKIDSYRLTQIILNLVGNAAKFTEKGMISMSVRWLRKEKVDNECFQPIPYDDNDEGAFEKEEAVFNEDDYEFLYLDQSKFRSSAVFPDSTFTDAKGILKIAIKDTGVGIPGAELEKIFTKFSQVSKEAGKKKLGTGLGLFITKELVRRMGGEIRVYSQEGRGSCFIVCIPCETILARLQRLPSLINMDTSDAKIMIVDDDSLNVQINSRFLTRMKVGEMKTAKNGIEALNSYKAAVEQGKPFDLITMDLDMPFMNGKEASKKIRLFERERHLARCPIIMISGHCTETEITECLNPKGEVLAQAFLKKPVTFDDFRREILTALKSFNH